MRKFKFAAVFIIAGIFCAFFVHTGLAAPKEEVRYFRSGDIVSPEKIGNASGDNYVNLGDISGAKGNVSSVSGSSTATYDSKTGMASFQFRPDYVSYKYNTKAKRLSDKYMYVELRTSDKPVIVSGYVDAAKGGSEYSFSLEASGKTPLTWHIVSNDLPAGLSIDQVTGKISGTPEEIGKFNFTVMAENSEGRDSREFTMDITATPPKFVTTSPLPEGKTGTEYSLQLEVSGWKPVTWTISSGSLPDGLTLNKSTGIISGIPTKTGTFSFKVKANNAAGTTSKTFKLTIKNRISVSGKFQTPGYLRVQYDSSVNASGGTIPYTVQLASGKLPNGLSLSASGNEIVLSGKPTKTGTYKFKLNITDFDGYSLTTGQYTVKITGPAIKGSLKNGTVGEYYSASLTASGGTGSYKWAKSSGTLPTKLSMIRKDNGKILELAGTLTKAGTYTFKLKLTDANNAYVTKTFTVTVGTAVTVKTPGKYSDGTERESEENDEAGEKVSLSDDSAEKEALTLAHNESEPDINGSAFFITSLGVSSDDVLISYEGKDRDLVSVRAGMPVTFILGTWVNADGDSLKVYDEKVFIDDKPAEGIIISEGEFTLPSEMIHDDFKVCVKAKAGSSEIESEEVFISAED